MTNVSSSIAAVPDALRDIKPPVEVFQGWKWIYLSLAGLLVVAVVAYIVRLISLLLQERRKLRPQERVLLPHEIARKAFDAALAFVHAPRQFGIVISDALRQYLEQRFQLRAPERTTEEFLLDLQKTVLLSPDQKETLKEFLGRCDLIKFSKHEPAENELRALHSTASTLVESSKDVPTPVVNIVVDARKLQQRKQAKRMAITGIALQSAPILWLALFGWALPTTAQLLIQIATKFSWNLKELLLTYNEVLNGLFPHFPLIAAIAWLLGLAGWILLAMGVRRYRAEWFCWFLVFFSFFLFLVFPIGSAFAIFFLAYVQTHRSEFFQAPKTEGQKV